MIQIKITTKQILKGLQFLSYLIFIGLCIDAGAIMFNTFYTLTINSTNAKSFLQDLDLSPLYRFDQAYFITEAALMIIVTSMQALLFYLIIKILQDKKLDLKQPYTTEMKIFISNMSYLAIGIGLFSFWGAQYTKGLIAQGITMPDIESLRLGGADVWLFMGIILLVIAHIFKRGMEMQSENELTI